MGMSKQTPHLPTAVVNWVYKHARNNYWRLAPCYELDDMIQDGLMCAYKCANVYGLPGEIPTEEQIETRKRLKNYTDNVEDPINPKHFMRLVQTVFYNYIGDLTRKKFNSGDYVTVKLADMSKTLSEHQVLDRIVELENDQDFFEILMDLPDKLRKVVNLYVQKPELMRQALRIRLNSENESLSNRLARLAGFPEYEDFETELRSFLWERQNNLL